MKRTIKSKQKKRRIIRRNKSKILSNRKFLNKLSSKKKGKGKILKSKMKSKGGGQGRWKKRKVVVVPKPTYDDYQNLLISILGVEDIYMGLIDYINERDHPQLQRIQGQKTGREADTPWFGGDYRDSTIIYWYAGRDYTHYRVYGREYNPARGRQKPLPSTIDPYDLYQKNETHGFCQMFALFIAMNDEGEFTKIGKRGAGVAEVVWIAYTKQIYLNNTYVCLQKTLKLIEESRHHVLKDSTSPRRSGTTLYDAMEKDFNNFRDTNEPEGDFLAFYYPETLSFEGFLDHLSLFKKKDIKPYIDGLYL